MGLLYKKQEDVKYRVTIKEVKNSDNVVFTFDTDCGKFHTWECIYEVEMTPIELLNRIRGCD